jgi:hypothetical protein
MQKKLYLVHCGFYDTDLCDGIYESHVNFLIAAESFEDARTRARLLPEFKTKKMHVDGLQEIAHVSGCHVRLEEDAALEGRTLLINQKHRDLAPKPATADTSVPAVSMN